MKRYWIFRVLRMILFACVAAAGLGYAVMALWNATLPAVAGLHSLSFVQALGLLVLCRLLFGGLRGRGNRGWRGRIHHRWRQMTPEEREQFRSRFPCGATRGQVP